MATKWLSCVLSCLLASLIIVAAVAMFAMGPRGHRDGGGVLFGRRRSLAL
jgi:hypothetical protein